MSNTCATCRWWQDSGLVARTASSVLHGDTKGSLVALGYCGVEYKVPIGPLMVGGTTPTMGIGKNKGLTDEDYSCGEHKDKTNDTD